MVRRVRVQPNRLPGWVERFEASHGLATYVPTENGCVLLSPDGARAEMSHPWEPHVFDSLESIVAFMDAPRSLALLLVRKRASAVGVVVGNDLVSHRVQRYYVQGKTKAGGWSQQRYARRRGNQASYAYQQATDDAVDVLVSHKVEWLVTGGDPAGITEVLDDPRLTRIAEKTWNGGVLDVPEPRFDVLQQAARDARAIVISLNEAATKRA